MTSGRTDEWTYGSTHRQTDHLTYEWTFRPSHCGYKDYEIDHQFAHPLTRSLAPLTHLFACTAHSLAPAIMGKRFKSLK